MAKYQHDSDSFKIQFFLGIILLALLVSFGVVHVKPSFALALTGVLTLFLIGFLKTELALYFLIVSMLLSPEIILGAVGGGESLEARRSLIIRLDDLFIVIIGLSWLARTAVYKELGLFLKTPLNRPILYYILVCFFATTLGVLFGRVNGRMGFFYVLKYIEYFIIYFIVANNLQTEDQARRYVIAILLTCVIVCVIAIIQIPEGRRVTAPFEGNTGEPNTLGGYLVLSLSIVLGLLLSLKSIRERLILGVTAALILIPFAYTLSRSSWIAVGPMVVVLFIFSPRRRLLSSIVILALILGLVILPPTVKDRITYTFTEQDVNSLEIGGITLDPSASARIRSWRQVLRDFKNHPLLGYGVTGYSFVDSQYFRILIELGLLGLVVFLYLLFCIFWQVRISYQQVGHPLHRGFVLGMLAGIPAIYTHAIGANTFIIIRIMEPFWFLLAIAVVLPQIERAGRQG
jgi:O-antigen ligase